MDDVLGGSRLAACVSKAPSRFHAEAARVTPHGRDPVGFARKASQTATFEWHSQLHAVKRVREGPTHSFQAAGARAKKHETIDLRGAVPQSPDPSATHISSVSAQNASQLAETVGDQDRQI